MGRTRRVRNKQTVESDETQVNIRVDEILDLVVAGVISSAITIGVKRSFNNG